jgi:ABC-2 type transport system permease protein
VRHVSTVAGRELRSLFVSPVAYGVLSLFSVLAGLFFILNLRAFDLGIMQLQQFQAFDQLAQVNLNDHLIAGFYASLSVVLLFLVPGITMGLLASEKTNGTQELLLTSPITIWDIVLGKFLAAALFVALLVVIVGLFPALLFVYGDPEVGKTASGLIGLLLVGWTYVAIGVFASAITRSQVIAFLVAFVLLLCLLLLPVISELGVAGGSWMSDFLRYLSTDQHRAQLVKGLVDTADLGYFAVMIGTFILACLRCWERWGWSGSRSPW